LRDVEASNAATKLDLTEAKRMLSKTMNS